MSDEPLDFSVEGMTGPARELAATDFTDPWLARRQNSFGCSDLPALLAIYDRTLAPWDEIPSYTKSSATPARAGAFFEPRLFLQKAGLLKTGVGSAARKGAEREKELLYRWNLEQTDFVRGETQHASALPRELWPLVSRQTISLTCTPDAFARDLSGDLALVELKCSVKEKAKLPWVWLIQIQGEILVTGAAYGVCVLGERWAAWHGDDGKIKTWTVEPSAMWQDRILKAAEWGATRVKAIKERLNGK